MLEMGIGMAFLAPQWGARYQQSRHGHVGRQPQPPGLSHGPDARRTRQHARVNRPCLGGGLQPSQRQRQRGLGPGHLLLQLFQILHRRTGTEFLVQKGR